MQAADQRAEEELCLRQRLQQELTAANERLPGREAPRHAAFPAQCDLTKK